VAGLVRVVRVLRKPSTRLQKTDCAYAFAASNVVCEISAVTAGSSPTGARGSTG